MILDSRLSRVQRLLALALLAGLSSCVDAPFARVNPNDVDLPLELRLVGSSTTASRVGEILLFQLVSTPPTVGYLPTWTSSSLTYLQPMSDGRFRVARLPATEPVAVVVRAEFIGRFAELIVTVEAAP